MQNVKRTGFQVPVRESPVAIRTPQLMKNGQRHVSIVCIRRDYMRCYVDGQMLFYLRTNYGNLQLQDTWSLRTPNTLAVRVCECAATFYKAQLKEVTGKATKVRGDGKETMNAEF